VKKGLLPIINAKDNGKCCLHEKCCHIEPPDEENMGHNQGLKGV